MSTPFHLLLVPDIVFEKTLDKMETSSVIHLSQCSKHFGNLVQLFESRRKDTELKVIIKNNGSTMTLKRADRKTFHWLVCSPRQPGLELVSEVIHRKIEGIRWELSENDGYKWVVVEDRENFETSTLRIVETLKNLFHCKIANIYIKFERNPDFERLLMTSQILHKATTIHISNCAFSQEEMRFMLQNFTSEVLRINGYAGRDFVYLEPVNCRDITIAFATWIDLEDLKVMATRYRKIELRSAIYLGDKDLNQFIKFWLSSEDGTLEKLEKLEIQRVSPDDVLSGEVEFVEFIGSEILDRIPGEPELIDGMNLTDRRLKICRADGAKARITVFTSCDSFLFEIESGTR